MLERMILLFCKACFTADNSTFPEVAAKSRRYFLNLAVLVLKRLPRLEPARSVNERDYERRLKRGRKEGLSTECWNMQRYETT